MTDRIDFNSSEDEDLVVRSRAGIAVYVNGNDDVVIRQDGGGYEDDAIVIVHRADVEALILALQNVDG